MATSSRQSSIFGVNDWKAIYQTFSQADFQSYDYETLRKSFIDYLRTNYPETFNDYTESSEYIALLDVIAFMGQSIAFRDDLNTRENFIDTAERRDSVIKLANLIGYNPKRNLAGQGYLKITGIQTTEQVKDINGLNLSNLVILWNDPANNNWKEQFNSVLNAALINSQRIGKPGHSNTVLGVKTEEYSINMPANTTPAIPFTASVDGNATTFEIVSATSLNEDYIYELPPSPNGIFNMLYRNDNLGFGSPNTGFFVYFKQGTLQTYDFSLAQRISNQVVDIPIQGVNDSDTWLYEINTTAGTSTKWDQVESVFSNTYLQTNSSTKKIYSVISGFNDQVSLSFGDGVFSEIPVGTYRAYVRTSNALQYTIDPIEVRGVNINIPYVNRNNRTETLTITVELTLPVNNAQPRESLANIKERAPTRYYTQNRMVNGEDYNNFPYTLYSSIIKSKAINRSSVGVSRNLDLLDPTAKYSSTSNFAEDGGIYVDASDGYMNLTFASSNDIASFLTQKLADVLQGHNVLQYYFQNYTRFPGYMLLGDYTQQPVLWHQTSYTKTEATGYFYTSTTGPIPTGTFNASNPKYISTGALLKFVAPSGYYFNSNNKLVPGIPGPSDKTFVWSTVLNVVGDGYNGGIGNLATGKGPISLSTPMPEGAIVDTIIPSFTNLLPNSVIQECITRMLLNKSFSLVFNNTLAINQVRWSVTDYPNMDYFINFENLTTDVYLVTHKSIAYYFGSVKEVRFVFDRDKIVYDPQSGKLLQDQITLLKSNSQPNSNNPLPRDLSLSVVGNATESDGYVDDFAIEVSTIDANNPGVINDPDFFENITGYMSGATSTNFVFFEKVTDANNLNRKEMVASSDVVFAYPYKSDIEVVKYEFPVGQIFYAYVEDTFYKINESATVANIITVDMVTTYSSMIGRQGLYFQYKHNSNNTTRIDPATTNIIDLYVVTQSYYTAYQNWIQDSTGIVAQPSTPDINSLNQSYSKINDYKMLSDSVILNSVRFKPLFGSKAEPKLRATIKVIKSSTTTASDSEIRSSVLNEINKYFSIDNWNFGDTFYFSELSAYIHSSIGDIVNSIVIVPNDPSLVFGDLYEIRSAPYEIFVNAAQTTDITVISALTPSELQISR